METTGSLSITPQSERIHEWAESVVDWGLSFAILPSRILSKLESADYKLEAGMAVPAVKRI